MEDRKVEVEAKNMISKFTFLYPQSVGHEICGNQIKSSALICVEELIRETGKKFWYDVKKHIEENY